MMPPLWLGFIAGAVTVVIALFVLFLFALNHVAGLGLDDDIPVTRNDSSAVPAEVVALASARRNGEQR